jgi:hypothetical protein
MLVLVDSKITNECKCNPNTDLVIIPGCMTSQLQVLNVVVSKQFKD